MVDPQESRFWKAAFQSELIDADGLKACWDAIPPEKRVGDQLQLDRRLARQAVHAGLLTLWQAQQLLAGRSTGFKINRYTLLDLIGQGGMGRVYLAKDTRLNRRVALKILSPERVNNPRAIARFQREARVGAQLQHENLVRIYDEGEANGKCYLVMEFIEGKNIGTLIADNGPMTPGIAAKLVRQVALGLEHAQQKGLIHRDVNPYNILVTNDGVAKLTDLGLAIDLAEQEPVTRDGATVGTFDYVSPEQARHSHSVDTRSDIYSLGCTIYHMLAGRVPFPSPSLPEKLFGHQALEPEALAGLVPGVPEGLVDIVRKMMRKIPDERYQSPKEVAQALEPFVEGLELSSSSSRDDTLPSRQVSPVAETRVMSHVEPAPALPPAPAAPEAGPSLDLGINLGGEPPEPAEAGIDLGIALDFGGGNAPAEPAAKPSAPPPQAAPAKPAAVAPKPAPPKAAPPPPKPAPVEVPLPDFTLGLSGEPAAAEPVNLGLNLNLEPPPPATAPPAKKPTAPAVAPAPAAKAPAPAKPTPPAKPAPAEAPALVPDFAFNLGTEGPHEDALNLGLNLDLAPAPAAAPAPKPAAAKAAPPPKPAPPPVPAEAPAAVPDFVFSLGGEAHDEAPLGLGLDLGPAPALAGTKPPPKPAPPKPAPPPQPQAVEDDEDDEDEDEEEEGEEAEVREKKPRKLDRRVLIGAGVGSLLVLVIVGAVVGMGLLGGKTDKSTTAKTKQSKASKSTKVAADGASKPTKTAKSDATETAVATTVTTAEKAKKSVFNEPPIPEGQGFAVRTGGGDVSKEPNLKSAMQRAIGSRGRVVLNNKEPLKLTGDDAVINISGGALVIAAEKGTQPVLEVEIKGGNSWLMTRAESPLTVIGVTIVAKYVGTPGPNPPPVIYSGSKVTLDHCTFRTSGAVPGSCAVTVEGESLTAVGCYFENFDRSLDFSAFSGPGATIKHCMMVRPKANAQPIGWALRVRNLPGGKSKSARKVLLDHCTVKGKGFVELADFSSEYPCEVQVKDCAVLADALLAWEHPKPGDAPLSPESLRWSGVGNTYDVQTKSWVVLNHDGTEPLADGPSDISSWNQRMSDRNAAGGPLKFQTDAGAMPAEGTAPIDFTIPDQGDLKVGADPEVVGPSGKPAK
ncbi:MAG: serine/threonine-protein kinase [Isosphaeraceae bacterium]|nr:serine/threonine-protein kinase [Isosphaeraceae bacterium]